ncbi:MAG TPA: tetratricopeptide repeat protein [Bryobacteraceae bacterium]|nr:tetratricopeptide repeat protein [Bryobacteraceae bacterium]
MKRLLLFLTPLLLCADDPNRVTKLVETMRQLTFAGDQPAVGRLVPTLIHELAMPHAEGALAWNQIGVYHVGQGNSAEAERAYRRGIRLVEQTGTDRGTLALLLVNLGELYLEAGGRAEQALTIVKRALKRAEESHGSDSEELSNFIYVLGAAQSQCGNRRDARRQFERALVLAGQSKDGKIRRGLILANLAVLRAEDKEWNEARDIILQALALLEQNLGVAHPELVPTYLNLARIQRQFKRWDLAGTALERARVITETQLGPEHRYMVGILQSSSFVLKKTGRRSEAREQARRAKLIAASLPRVVAGETLIHVSELRR